MGHVVHSGVSEAQNIITLFFMPGGTGTDLIKSMPGHISIFSHGRKYPYHV
jgi:hypothetical protein